MPVPKTLITTWTNITENATTSLDYSPLSIYEFKSFSRMTGITFWNTSIFLFSSVTSLLFFSVYISISGTCLLEESEAYAV